MDTQQQRVRSCSRKSVIERLGTHVVRNRFAYQLTSDLYKKIWDNAAKVRHLVDSLIKTMPEVFSRGIQDGVSTLGALTRIGKNARHPTTTIGLPP